MRDTALQRAIRQAALGRSLEGIPAEDVRAMEPQRLLLYRALVRNALFGTLEQMLPRTHALLGEEAWDECVSRFLDESPPKTHYIRDVPHELFAFAKPFWQSVVIDCARHELAILELSSTRGTEPPTLVDLALDRQVVFASAVKLARYDHAVHEADPPPARPTSLLLYRDADHVVRALELTPLAYATIENLLAAQTLEAAVRDACTTPTPDILQSIATLLADLGARGVVLGGAITSQV